MASHLYFASWVFKTLRTLADGGCEGTGGGGLLWRLTALLPEDEVKAGCTNISYSSSPALLEPLFGNDLLLLATGSLNVVGMS